MEAIIGIRGETVFKERTYYSSGQLIFWLVETIFFYFSETSVSEFFFRLVETMFQENPSFRLVETDFRVNNGFRKKKEKL